MEKNNSNNKDDINTNKQGLGGLKTNSSNNNDNEQEENANNNNNNLDCETETEGEGESQSILEQPCRSASRTPFTNLSQIDADLALARTLQEQERAYMILRMNNEGSDYGSWDGGSSLDDDEDDFDDPKDDDDDVDDDDEYDGTDADDEDNAFDVRAHDVEEDNSANVEVDPSVYTSDEAYARELQEAEEREIAARLLALAGINDRVDVPEDLEDQGHNSQDAWEEVDPDELSYEELLALGEVVGTESRGLSEDTIASLPSVNYKTGSSQNGNNDSCVICRLDYEENEMLTVLSCTHSYHSECINNWLKINKVCPVCSMEVSTSGRS